MSGWRALCLAAVLLPCASAAWARGGGGRAGTLAGFESGIQTVPPQEFGFRPEDVGSMTVTPEGAARTKRSAKVVLGPGEGSVFFQGKVRRVYLANRRSIYEPDLFNALVLWLKVPKGSPLVGADGRDSFGVWTYHWRPGDVKVGGSNNQSLGTDSMMHGYANFSLAPGCEERWVKVVLSASAFKQQRDYFHWFAAQGVTGEYDLFSTLRQLQFVYLGPPEQTAVLQMDEVGFGKLPETALVEPGFVRREADADGGDVLVPIVVRNPTAQARSYRYFVSSEIGAPREAMYQAFWTTDDLKAMRQVQEAAGGDGGVGAVSLLDREGMDVGWSEITVPPRSEWRGAVAHRVKRPMLGRWEEVALKTGAFAARRNVLTTSLIVWDPREPPAADMACVRSAPSNADDGRHAAPPGFPAQARPPEGWRSEDVPLGQVGGYFVSEIELR